MENKKSDGECVMPNYKAMYEEAAKQAEYWKQEYERRSLEVSYLRAIKHTTEAFLEKAIIGEEDQRWKILDIK